MTQQVIVIGAGPGGLTSAILLAKAGYEVTVIERQDRVGGRTSSFTMDGFRFDLGPTFFHYPQVLEEILDSVGVDLWEELDLRPLNPQYRLQYSDGEHLDVMPGFEAMRDEIERLAPGDSSSLEAYLSRNEKKLRLFSPILKRPFERWRDLLSPEVLKALPVLTPWRSVQSDIAKYFKDPRIQLAFTFQSKYLGMSPFKCPSLFTILAFLEHKYGIFHPIGGCAEITRMLARVAQDLGVRIRLSEEVVGLEIENRRVMGVQTRTACYRADATVINADFARAMQSLVPNGIRRRWTNRRLEKKKYSCSTFMLYLGLEGQVNDLPHHTISLSRDYRKTLAEIQDQKVLPQDPSVYVQNACVTDPSLAPAGNSTLYVLTPVPHQNPAVDWSSERNQFRETILDKVSAMGVDGLRDRIRCEQVITPADWDRKHNIFRGATFNLAHGLTQMLHFRPHNRFEDLNGVYLVGGGTHPGSGLPTIFSSAKISSDLVCEDLGNARPANTAGVRDSVRATKARQPRKVLVSGGEGRRLPT